MTHPSDLASPEVTPSTRGRPWVRALLVASVIAVGVGVPTDVIDTPWFTRMTPVRGWEYPLLVATVLLAGFWAWLPGRPGRLGGLSGSGLLTALAIGCPVCNKLIVALLGVSGALGVWAPIQPLLGIASVLSLAVAVVLRWRVGRSASCRVQPIASP